MAFDVVKMEEGKYFEKGEKLPAHYSIAHYHNYLSFFEEDGETLKQRINARTQLPLHLQTAICSALESKVVEVEHG